MINAINAAVSAVIYCEGAFGTTYGKTAHGLVRFSRRYHVSAVIDSTLNGRDAGEFLEGKPNGIPIVKNLAEAFKISEDNGESIERLVVGVALEGRHLPAPLLAIAGEALETGLDIDSGLHVFLSEHPDLALIAERNGRKITDIRKPPPREELHFFSGKIDAVGAYRLAVLGTDSAIGKRTTAWIILKALEASGVSCALVGTGQTAWMQGADPSIILDSLVNDFVSGEIEHAVFTAWERSRPSCIVIEGQGSLMNPAFPGGFEILAAARPDGIILQHAPARKEYDGFPGFPLHPLPVQIQAIELISGRKVLAISLNHEQLSPHQIGEECRRIEQDTGLPCCDPLTEGPAKLINAFLRELPGADRKD